MEDTAETRFVDRLYDAAVDPLLWPPVMEALADLLGGASGWLTRMSVADGSGEGVLARIDPAMATLYETYYASLNPFSNEPDPDGFMRDWRPEILLDSAWLPRAELERTEYYNDFMRPQGIYTGMIIRLAAYGRDVCALTMTRTPRQGAFGSAEMARAQRLHGHLRRAFRLSEELAAGAAGLPSGVAQALDVSPNALLVLGRSGRIRRANARAEAILRQGDILTAREGRLSARDPNMARELDGLLAAAGARDPTRRTAGEMMLAQPEPRPPLALTAAPVRGAYAAVFETEPAVLVSIHDRYGAALSGSGERALTTREQDVLHWVAAGKSDWEIGAILGLSQTTVRFHVDNARRKLGAVNRAQAVALLLSARTTH